MERLRTILNRPRLAYRVIVVMAVGFWFVSAIGQGDEDADGFAQTVGAMGWALFFLTMLIAVVYTAFQLARLLRRRTGQRA